MSMVDIRRTIQGWTIFVNQEAHSTYDDYECAEQNAAWIIEELNEQESENA